MKVSWKLNMIISAAVTVGAFLAADRLLEFKWWVDTIIALVFGGIVNQLILQDKKEDHEIEMVPGLTRQEFKESMAIGKDWTRKMDRLAKSLEKSHARIAVDLHDISDMVATLFKNFETDPKDLVTTDARRLINDHLPRAHRFIEAYVTLRQAQRLSDNEQEKLTAMEDKITTIKESFAKHLEGFRNNDFTALAIEGETMETIYNLDI
ncbi:MAG: hypothetical protein D3926_01860 [Desulfobacteraceae bacterium]|nr:MAG: hypothetical protein D3926_01860 [Desulfobacteraceae bacterium]